MNQPWPLRMTLALVVVVLIIVGVQSSRTSTVNAATSTTIAGTPTTSTTITTKPTSFAPPGRGCRLNLNPGAGGSRASTSAPLGHCTVLEVGDSIGNDLGWGLARELAGTPGLRLIQDDTSSTGLTTPWFYNWPTHLVTDLASAHPQLTIVTFGANDEQGLVVKGHAVAFASAPWARAYRTKVSAIDRRITATGSYVLWVGLPIVEPNGYRQGLAYLNTFYQSVARQTPGVTYLSTWRLFANARGQYESVARVNGVASGLRSSDGIHFSYVGENVDATFVARSIASIYHVHLVAKAPMVLSP